MEIIERTLVHWKQYGFRKSSLLLLKKPIKVLYFSKSRYVMIKPNHNPISKASIVQRLSKNQFPNHRETQKWDSFLDNGCVGFYVQVGKELAGWGFIQSSGSYKYGDYFYEIQEGFSVLKNLYIDPAYRGKKLGPKINEARINAIPPNDVPIGFVLCENRFAIRNLEIMGFQKVLMVTNFEIFGLIKWHSIERLSTSSVVDQIIKGFDGKN